MLILVYDLRLMGGYYWMGLIWNGVDWLGFGFKLLFDLGVCYLYNLLEYLVFGKVFEEVHILSNRLSMIVFV